jgi:hypothetical protein
MLQRIPVEFDEKISEYTYKARTISKKSSLQNGQDEKLQKTAIKNWIDVQIIPILK